MFPQFYIPTFYQEMLRQPSIPDKDQAAIVASLIRDPADLADRGKCLELEWEIEKIDKEAATLAEAQKSHVAWLAEWEKHHA